MSGEARIYPDGVLTPGVPYRPSNGTEGAMFMSALCDRCERDAKYRKTDNGADGCKILVAALCFDIGDVEYPMEWIVAPSCQPSCIAFEPERKR